MLSNFEHFGSKPSCLLNCRSMIFVSDGEAEMLHTPSRTIHRALSMAEGKDISALGTLEKHQRPFSK